MLIDVHTHYMPQALGEVLGRRAQEPRLFHEGGQRLVDWGGGIVYPLWREAVDIGSIRERMSRHGITTSVLSVITPSVESLPAPDGIAVARACNDELAELACRNPGRIEGVAALPWQAPEAAVAELQRARTLGLRGAQVHSNVAGKPLDSPEFAQVFDAAAELDLPVVLHPAHPLSAASVEAYALTTTLGFLFDTSTAALRLILGGLFARHPAFKLYLCHIGSILPYVLGRLDYEAARYDGAMGALEVPPSEHVRLLYTDSVCVWPPGLRLALEVFGPDRVMFGSDEPFWATDRALDTVGRVDLSEQDSAQLYSGAAARLFGLDTDSA